MEITYHWEGDYLIPDLMPDSEPEEPLTKYGQMHMNYLEEHRGGIYTGLLLSGKLKAHCLEVQKQAEERMDVLTEQMAKAEGVDEALKASDQMKWVAKMNNIRHSAEEIILKELIYTL